MTFRKLLTTMLLSALTLSLCVSCGSTNGEKKTSSAPTQEPTPTPAVDKDIPAVTPADNTTYRIQKEVASNEETYNIRLDITNPSVADFADPELHRFTDESGKTVYWIYATGGNNARAAYSVDDMKTWTRVDDVIDMSTLPWVNKENPKIWAPSFLYKDGKYYLSFSNGDSHTSDPNAGLNITVADNPAGPFRAFTDGPIVWEHDDNYPSMAIIDQDLFMDEDGTVYMYYGGGGTCFCVKFKDDMSAIEPFADGETYKKIEGLNDYMEGPYMIKRGGVYYLMYSCGVWSNDSYHVSYATSDSPTGPFTFGRQVAATDSTGIHKGPGHHSAIYLPENNEWLICYHRWNKDDPYRSACIDRLVFNEDGSIRSVAQTDAWTTDDDFGPDKSNLALSATPFDAGETNYGGSQIGFINDGDGISSWQINDIKTVAAGKCWAALDFGAPTAMNEVTVIWESGTKPTEDGYELQISSDGENWTPVENAESVYGDTMVFTFPKTETQYLRVFVSKSTNDKYCPKIYELEARLTEE